MALTTQSLESLSILIALLAGLLWARRSDSARLGPAEPVFRVLLPVACALAAGAIIHAQGKYMGWDWNAARLAPVFALLKGFRLYYPADSGPILNTIYTPLSTLAYLPAGLAPSPSWALVIGLAFAQAYYYIPAWAILSVGRSGDASPSRIAFFSCCALVCVTTMHPMLAFCAASIHTDAPALAMILLAVLSLVAPVRPRWSLPAAALFAAAAFWTKQTTAPLLVVLPAAILILEGRRSAFKLAALEALFMLGFGVCFTWMFGAREMIFNTLTLPSKQGWMRDMPEFVGRMAYPGELLNHVRALRDATASFGVEHILWLMIPCWMLTAGLATAGEWRARLRLPILLMAAGLCMVPTGLLGWIKIGGNRNNLGYIVLPHLLALLILLREGAFLPAAGDAMRNAARTGLALLLGGALLLKASTVLLPNEEGGMWDWQTAAQVAYETEIKRPGEVYFPKNPLGALMANGHLYMFDYGVQDRTLSDFPVEHDHFMRHVPPGLKYIAWSTPGPEDLIMKHFPDFTKIESPPELDKFFVFEQPAATPTQN